MGDVNSQALGRCLPWQKAWRQATGKVVGVTAGSEAGVHRIVRGLGDYGWGVEENWLHHSWLLKNSASLTCGPQDSKDPEVLTDFVGHLSIPNQVSSILPSLKYIYIYIYICVCVCVCVCIFFKIEFPEHLLSNTCWPHCAKHKGSASKTWLLPPKCLLVVKLQCLNVWA